MKSTTWQDAPEKIRVWIRSNGTSNAWPRRIGDSDTRSIHWEPGMWVQPRGFVGFPGVRHPKTPARTSISLLLEVEGSAVGHLLFDCGCGVVESLALAHLTGIERCTWLFVTHPHPDHLDPNALVETLRRAPGNDRSSFRLLTYGSEFVETMLAEKYPYERRYIDFRTVSHGTPIEDLSPVWVMPLGVAHGRCRGAHCFIVAVLGRRIVVAFDLDLPDAVTASGRTNLQVFEDAKARGELDDTTLLILDGNTFRARGTGHNTIVDSGAYLEVIQPARTMFVHFSGAEDSVGDGRGFLDSDLEAAAQTLYGLSVSVPAEGQMFSL